MIVPSQINTIDDLKILTNRDVPVICLYSGGLDGTFLLYKLQKLGFKKVVALTINIGQLEGDESVKRLVESLGAIWQCLDAKTEFILNYIYPAIYCNATYLGGHPISASLSRPLFAEKAVKEAIVKGCKCILHTSNASQNSLRRFNTAIKMLGFEGCFGSPFSMTQISRSEKISTLKSVGISWEDDKQYSIDDNLWIHEFEYGDADNPEEIIIPQSLLKLTNRKASDPCEVTITFEEGIPVRINGKEMDGSELIGTLNNVIGSYGHGRYVWLEELPDGRKVQEIREAPAALILFDAYRRIESAILSSEDIREKQHIEQLWVREASEGRWFGKLRPACQAFAKDLAKFVTGQIRYVLTPEGIQPKSLKANKPLYIIDRQIYEKGLANNRHDRP